LAQDISSNPHTWHCGAQTKSRFLGQEHSGLFSSKGETQIGKLPGRPDWANFRPMGGCFTMGSFFKHYRSSTKFWASFPQSKFITKMNWPKFWAILSLTHLVTL
jgi:hypothetical protein